MSIRLKGAMDLLEVNVVPSSRKPLIDVDSEDGSGASMNAINGVKEPIVCEPPGPHST